MINKITILEADTIVDIIAENMYYVLDYTDICDYTNETIVDGIITLTKDSFIKICEVLNIEKIEI